MAKTVIDNRQLRAIQKQVKAMDTRSIQMALRRVLSDLDKQSQNPVMNYTAGLMFSRIGALTQSADHLKRALKKARDNDIILGTLIFVYTNQLRDHKSALEYLKQKAKLNHNDAKTLYIMANSYVELGEINKALGILKKAEKFADAEILSRVMAMRVRCYQRLGDSISARRELLKIAEIEPSGLISAAETLARLPDNTEKLIDELEQVMSKALATEPEKFRNDMHKAMTANALGNIHEKRKQYETAFNWYVKANELHPKDETAASHLETHEFDTLKAIFTPELFERDWQGHPSDEQIFVLGMPRSGTTLIESLLGAHPRIKDFGELDFFINQLHGLGITSPGALSKEKRKEQVLANVKSAPADGFHELGQQFIKQNGFDRFPGFSKVDKMPHNFRALGLISLVFPNARIIHAKRHPMDICLSIFKNLLPGYHTTFAKELTTLGEFYIEYAKLMRHWEKVLPLKIHEVRYEEMVTDTEQHARALIEFTGHEWSDKCLANRKDKRDVNTASIWQVRQDIYNTSVQKWRIYEKQLKPLTQILADEIAAYEASAWNGS